MSPRPTAFLLTESVPRAWISAWYDWRWTPISEVQGLFRTRLGECVKAITSLDQLRSVPHGSRVYLAADFRRCFRPGENVDEALRAYGFELIPMDGALSPPPIERVQA